MKGIEEFSAAQVARMTEEQVKEGMPPPKWCIRQQVEAERLRLLVVIEQEHRGRRKPNTSGCECEFCAERLSYGMGRRP